MFRRCVGPLLQRTCNNKRGDSCWHCAKKCDFLFSFGGTSLVEENMRVIESSRRERWRDLSSSSFFFSETGSPQRIFNSAPSAAGCCARGEIRKRTRHFQHTENTHSHSVGRSHLVRWVLPINAHSLVRSLPTLRAPATMINPKNLFFLASVASV